MKKKVICLMMLLAVALFTACNDDEPQVPAAADVPDYETAAEVNNDTEDNTDESANHDPFDDDFDFFDLLTDEQLEEVMALFDYMDYIFMSGDFTDDIMTHFVDMIYHLDELLRDVLPQEYIDELWGYIDELQALIDLFSGLEDLADTVIIDQGSDRWVMDLAPGWTQMEMFGMEVIISPSGMANMNVLIEDMQGVSLEEYINLAISNLEEFLPGFELTDRGDASGILFIEYTSDLADSTTQFLIEHNGEVFIITYTVVAGDGYIDDIINMLDSFRIVG